MEFHTNIQDLSPLFAIMWEAVPVSTDMTHAMTLTVALVFSMTTEIVRELSKDL
jgi:hypothetical protein